METLSMTPMTAMSMGEFGRLTLVMALKPSVTSSTRSPTPASTASTAMTAAALGPSRFSGWTRSVSAFVAGVLVRGRDVADDARDQHRGAPVDVERSTIPTMVLSVGTSSGRKGKLDSLPLH